MFSFTKTTILTLTHQIPAQHHIAGINKACGQKRTQLDISRILPYDDCLGRIVYNAHQHQSKRYIALISAQ